ncbi:hypothetical protein M758_2G141200 [Ceratodon purpureus]|nr:hypothetical protein M758_2G141200 [Ceratodon purpureus]
MKGVFGLFGARKWRDRGFVAVQVVASAAPHLASHLHLHEEGASMSMGGAVKQAYREVLKLIKRLPPQSQGYYSQYARENFITYSEPQDAATVRELLARAHRHSCWILNKYGVNEAAANRLKEICLTDHVQNPA